MAYLAGLDFPVNSVGELPLAYISASPREKAEASLANALSVLEMYRVKDEQKKAVELRYKPFPLLGDEEHSVVHRVQVVREHVDAGRFEEAIQKSQELLHICLKGLSYLQTYDWLFLRALVTLGYLGWIAFAVTTVIDMHVLNGKTTTSRTYLTSALFGAAGIVLFSTLLIRRAASTYYLYAVFPILFWEAVASRSEALRVGGKALLEGVNTRNEFIWLGIGTLTFLAILEALVRISQLDCTSEINAIPRVYLTSIVLCTPYAS